MKKVGNYMLRKILKLAVIVGAAVALFTTSGDVRAVVAWVLLGYLLWRAAPGINHDFGLLFRRVRLRRLNFRREGNNTL